MKIRLLAYSVALMAVSGCVTLSKSEYPAVELAAAPVGAPAVALSGFEAFVTVYQPIYGYATVWNSASSFHRGRHHAYAYPETVTTTSYVPQTHPTTAYIEKAQNALEAAGYVVNQKDAACTVNVRFDGPVITDSDNTLEFLTMLCSLFTVDRSAALFTAHLKVTDAATGRVLFARDYTQDYQAYVFGLVPIFGPLSADDAQSPYIQSWCLGALTDRAMADATAFLSAAFGNLKQEGTETK